MSKSQIARQKRNNSWHKIMYDNYLARTTIGSKRFVEIADKEAKFLSSVLGLTEGDRILDVPCGTGRHSRVFALLGYHVTGIDLNQYCLNLAKASCQGLKVNLQRGDMAKLSKYRDKFDAVVNLFTSFGYFATDKENEKVLRELITPLRSGGESRFTQSIEIGFLKCSGQLIGLKPTTSLSLKPESMIRPLNITNQKRSSSTKKLEEPKFTTIEFACTQKMR